MIENTPDGWDSLADAATPWEAAMWSANGQMQRFVAARALLDLREGDSLLDFGCGNARFSELVPRGVDYVGYDWSPAMRARAREDHPDVSIIESLGPAPSFTHTVCIGVFNLRNNWSSKKTLDQLEALWVRTETSLVVSLYAGPSSPTMLSYSVADVGDIAAYLERPKLLITNEHLPNDLMARFVRA